MYEIINDFYRFWKRFQVIIQQLLWLQEDLQCFHPKSGNEKKRVFRENTVLTARHPALSGMNESDQTFFVDIGKCFRYHTHYLILAETTSKNLCSDHSWKHQRDERDQRRSSQISFIRTRFFHDMFDCDSRGAVLGSHTDVASLWTIEECIAQSHNPVARLSWECQNPKFQKKIENVNLVCLNSSKPWHLTLKFRRYPLVHIRVHSKRSKKSPHGLPVSLKPSRISLVAHSFSAGRARCHSLRARRRSLRARRRSCTSGNERINLPQNPW